VDVVGAIGAMEGVLRESGARIAPGIATSAALETLEGRTSRTVAVA
jgi:hypothetical protein